MSWLSAAASIIMAAFPLSRKQRVMPPEGLEGARIGYVNQGREGTVVFMQGLNSFEMYFAYGGRDTLATIDIPSASEWSARTGTPLAKRDAVLEFIGQSVARDQTTEGRGRYEIHDQYISIHV